MSSLTGADSDRTTLVRHFALALLVVVYTFNFIDRQILSILIQPIKEELGLSDTLMGLLTGFAFAAFYATLGIPIARYADRGNRRNLIALALAVWSFMTAVSGLAQNFWHMLIARIGVGVGEAGCSPPAHSIISDLYPAHQRATALGIYSLGIPVGIMFGLFAGGWINEFFGWRMAFFVVGIPGILLALLVRFAIREPERGQAEGRVASATQPSVGETLAYLLKKRSFLHLAFAAALTAFVGYGVVTWVPTFLIRSYGLGTGEIGTWFGLILGIPGGIGIALGGYLADKFGAKDARWYLWTTAVALVVATPFSFAIYLSTSAEIAFIAMIIPILLGNFYQATTFSQTQGLVELRMRAVAAGILLFIINIVGLGLGPTLVGITTDLLTPFYGDEALRYSLLGFSLINLWAAFHYFVAGRHLKDDLVLEGH
ncbi:MAG: MFS transporter [Alphaproteobacteria bacterium]|nr:MFS transporter [Alphaproteobacteria bacterium]MBO6627672.1 MFS transporter [Alphaproteobacteria bacterium]MDF1627454.1 MFS transporter [Parvibaculaceae bacterium]